jgi:PEP-CTERM motif
MKQQNRASIKAIALCAAIAVMLATAANAANVTWQTPVSISGASDISTLGTFFGSWAPGNDWGGTDRADYFPVNGVTFAAYGTSGANFSFSGAGINMDRYNGFADPGTADANYNHLLHTAEFNWNAGSSSLTVSWNGMTVGTTYLVEAWLNDGRGGQSGSSVFTGGSNTSDPVAIGNGAPGQYIIGTYVADSDAQSFTMSPGIMLNLLQVREVPEPSTLAFLAMGTGALFFGFRRKNRAA